MLRRIPPLVGVIGINAVPAAGFFAGGWSASQTMLLYLLENLSLVVLAALRVRLFVLADQRKSLVSTFLMVGLGFSGVSAIFVAFFLFAIIKAPVDLTETMQAFGMIAAVQLGVVAYDAAMGPRPLPVANGEKILEQTLGRVFLLAMAVFIGMFVAAFVERWFVVPFMILKTIVDVGTQVQFIAARFGSARPAQS